MPSENPNDVLVAGAVVVMPPPRLASHPRDLAEPDTRLPRRGRTRNIATGAEVRIEVVGCEPVQQAPGACLLTAEGLAGAVAEPLEVLPPDQVVWQLAVRVGEIDGVIDLPADAFSRDEAVEVAWRRISLVAQRCILPAQEA